MDPIAENVLSLYHNESEYRQTLDESATRYVDGQALRDSYDSDEIETPDEDA